MPIPNTIVRTIDLSHPLKKVWSAVTTPDGLSSWFGSRVTGEVTPGGDIQMYWDQYDGATKPLAIKVLEPMSLFAYTWGIDSAPAGDPRQTYVEFALEATEAGTRLTVTETGFAQLPDEWLEGSYESHVAGWKSELGELEEYLDAARVA